MKSTATKQSQWKAKNTTLITMRLNNNTDTDILQKLEAVPNKQGYIKALIRADLAKDRNE